ncbi:MAG: DNA repair protein RecO [Bacteroidota bacterium]
MLHKTRGIVLSAFKYRETSLIVRIFTEALGMQSYIVQGVRAKRPRYSIALFQPMTLLDLVVYHKKQASLQRIAEAKYHTPTNDILGNLKKATIAVFLAELLTKLLREEAPNPTLFDFLWQSVLELDGLHTGEALFHLHLMLKMAHHLGFGVSQAQELETQLQRAGQHEGLTMEVRRLLEALLQDTTLNAQWAGKAVRRSLLANILKFYQLHTEGLDTLKSLKVMQELG